MIVTVGATMQAGGGKNGCGEASRVLAKRLEEARAPCGSAVTRRAGPLGGRAWCPRNSGLFVVKQSAGSAGGRGRFSGGARPRGAGRDAGGGAADAWRRGAAGSGVGPGMAGGGAAVLEAAREPRLPAGAGGGELGGAQRGGH